MSLTGDPTTDALVPIAQRFVEAVHEHDAEMIDESLAEVIIATGGRCDPAVALAVVLAALIPDGHSPSALLAWIKTRDELERLTTRGVSPGIAGQLTMTQLKRTAA